MSDDCIMMITRSRFIVLFPLLKSPRIIIIVLSFLLNIHGLFSHVNVSAFCLIVQDQACKIENVEFSMTDIAIRLAVTVIACEPRSQRGTEMLVGINTKMP